MLIINRHAIQLDLTNINTRYKYDMRFLCISLGNSCFVFILVDTNLKFVFRVKQEFACINTYKTQIEYL